MTTFQPKINEILLVSNYPHYVNDRFSNLVLPQGLCVTQYYEPPNSNYNVCNNNECIQEPLYNKLIELVEVKSKPSSLKNNTKKRKKSNKKNTKKAKST
tara:strand:+ start:99 stop:395 length:297 start_codon:yes stop_codon:yes gene_type:complete